MNAVIVDMAANGHYQRMGARWRENVPTVGFPQAEHQRDLYKATSGWEFQNKTRSAPIPCMALLCIWILLKKYPLIGLLI